MKYNEAKHRFIQSWGALGSSWGVSRTMAQVHAVLLLASNPLNTDDIMDALQISRGNASMSLKSLQEWGLIEKDFVPGDRKEYYSAEKDMWRVATRIAHERKKRELQPIIHMLEDIQDVAPRSATKSEIDEMQKVSSDILSFAKRSDQMLNAFMRAEKGSFFGRILKLFK